MKLRLGHHDRNDHGAAAVELALILPILILLLFGIFEFGRAYNTQNSLSGAAREGARVMAITNDSGAATDATIAAAPSVNPPPSVAINPTPCSTGATVTVTATRVQAYNIPFYGSASFNLTGRGVMRCGG
jgi:Flp pilus assembly protein TadG